MLEIGNLGKSIRTVQAEGESEDGRDIVVHISLENEIRSTLMHEGIIRVNNSILLNKTYEKKKKSRLLDPLTFLIILFKEV